MNTLAITGNLSNLRILGGKTMENGKEVISIQLSIEYFTHIKSGDAKGYIVLHIHEKKSKGIENKNSAFTKYIENLR